MKRFLIFLLASVMIFSLVSCGGKSGGGDPSENPSVSVPDGGQTASSDATVSETVSDTVAPAENALIPGTLFQLDEEKPVVLGLSLSGNRSGTAEFNSADPAVEGIRCIFELNEWVEITPDTDAQDGLAVWVFRHREDPEEYRSAALSDESDGFAAYCELPFDPDAEPGASRGSFYLNPEDCEAGYYDLVFSLDGNATAVLLTRFYNEYELESKTDEELAQIMTGLE